MFRVAVSGRREQEASFFTVIVWRDQAEHAAQSPDMCYVSAGTSTSQNSSKSLARSGCGPCSPETV